MKTLIKLLFKALFYSVSPPVRETGFNSVLRYEYIVTHNGYENGKEKVKIW